ncbi:MAG: hypothetical protein K9N09_08920 [Candidatus Cloacimonetes bacterium]|nr:hypothetical protein [Candidatus Cloacimonadota bacterium]MCF7813964.1 hypothetical protein [Candidatus Cloacimonadota bacterium]MCF7868808.1 hypothetical protein [Candidatus Cloacimonadota bacterium]MCF7884067.1 hypothetical protein [Candidatus Cloacimonadota bacterium]
MYYSIIALHFIFLFLSIIGITILNGHFTKDQNTVDLFPTNGIFIAVAIVTPIFIYFGLSQLRKGRRINQLDLRMKISKEAEELYKNNLTYILYYFLRGIIYVPVSILGFLVIGNTIINSGEQEIIYIIIGFILIVLSLINSFINFPSKIKMISFFSRIKIDIKSLTELINQLEN